MGIQWEDDAPEDGRSKYPALLAEIKATQLSDKSHRSRWALIREFENEQSARQLVFRLKKEWVEFTFISRKGDDTTAVYARLKAEVTE